jgi:hypothetical protein
MTDMFSLIVFVATSASRSVRILQWTVIGVIFIFFLLVLRVIGMERRGSEKRSRAPQSRATKKSNSSAPLVLSFVAPEENAGMRLTVDDELTIGRAPSNDISTASDVYTSSTHARFYRLKRRLFVEDLGSTNGTYVNTERIARPTRLYYGDHVYIGSTELEVTR